MQYVALYDNSWICNMLIATCQRATKLITCSTGIPPPHLPPTLPPPLPPPLPPFQKRKSIQRLPEYLLTFLLLPYFFWYTVYLLLYWSPSICDHFFYSSSCYGPMGISVVLGWVYRAAETTVDSRCLRNGRAAGSDYSIYRQY